MDEMLIKEFLGHNKIGKVIENEPMYKHTTYKVGGPARFFIEVQDMDALKTLLHFVRENAIQHMVIGKGSDLLFSDREYEGIILSLIHI